MKRAWRDADRSAEVRGAAAAWRSAGLLDESAFASLLASAPTAGPNLGWTWRVLVFLCVHVGASAAIVLTFVTLDVRREAAAAAMLIFCGLTLALATEVLLDRCAFRPTGAEAATSLLAVGCLAAAAFVLGDHLHLRGASAARLGFAWSAAVLGLAAWRWGFRLYAGAAAVALLLLAAQFPGGRLAWAAAAALLAGGAARLLGAGGLTACHRGALQLVRVTALAAIYVALNYYSVAGSLLEEVGRAVGAPHHRPGDAALLLAAVGSGVYPLALLGWGARSRDRALIDLGVLTAALSLGTLRYYLPFAPLWVVLAVSGAALCAAAMALERWLRADRDGERLGFTAAPLYDEQRRERLLPVAAALALAPAAREIPAASRGPEGGGSFGGAGADGKF